MRHITLTSSDRNRITIAVEHITFIQEVKQGGSRIGLPFEKLNVAEDLRHIMDLIELA